MFRLGISGLDGVNFVYIHVVMDIDKTEQHIPAEEMRSQPSQDNEPPIEDTATYLAAELKHMGFDEGEISAAVSKFANAPLDEAIPASIHFLTRQDSSGAKALPRVIICEFESPVPHVTL
jgi:hypothetical protein